MAKPVTASRTLVASTAAIFLSLGAFVTTPGNIGKAADCAEIYGKDQIADDFRKYAQLMGALTPFIAVIARFSRKDLYTPNWMIGPNKKDVEKAESMPVQINQIAFQLSKVASTVSSLVPKDKPIDYSPDKMHDTVKDLLKQQIGKNITEGVALPPIDMGQARKTSLAELAAIAQEEI
jgi:PDZ domain-containing secreted protein